MSEKVHIVSIISPISGINNKVFKSLDEALECYKYHNNMPKDKYATSETVVCLQENVEVN